MKWIELNPDERVVIKTGTHYKLAGPGIIWVWPGQQMLVKFDTGVRSERFCLNEVRTAENIPVNITAQVVYQVDVSLLRSEILHLIPTFQNGVWLNYLRWRAEAVIRRVLAQYSWQQLGHTNGQQDAEDAVELELTRKLSRYMASVGLKVTGVNLINNEPPATLVKKYVQVTQDTVAMQWRAEMIKTYLNQFNGSLQQAKPFIKWELTNYTLHNHNGSQLMVTNSDPFADTPTTEVEPPHYLINLPLSPKPESVAMAR